jgi:bifunctional non-homologous end joining protein LigD
MPSKTASARSAKQPDTFGSVRLSNPDRVLFPDQGVTKRDLANYYTEVAQWILPHIIDRPLSIVRCPAGLAGKCFYQKHPPEGLPDVVDRIKIREKDEFDTYVVVRNLEGIIALVQFGALELHAWGSKADDIERPDRLIFDLDPDEGLSWQRVVEAAVQLRDFLAELGLQSFVKTTGGKGLHLVVPVIRKHPWPVMKQFAKAVADMMVQLEPRRYVSNMAKAARQGKIFVDYLRNERGATAIVPFSTRARKGASVSTPLAWKELSGVTNAQAFGMPEVLKRLRTLKRDPWDQMIKLRQSLTAIARRQLGIRA